MSIKNLIAQIQAKQAIANDDLKDATNNTRPMREGNKRAAKEGLVDLKNEYRRELLSSATFIVVTGSGAQELSDLVSTDPKSFVADSEGLYEEIIAKLDPRLYLNQQVNSSMFQSISNSLEEVAGDIGIAAYPQLTFKPEYAQIVTNSGQLQGIVKQAVNDSVGSELVGIYAVSKILEDAVARGHGDSFTPIALKTTDESFAVRLATELKNLSPNVFVVSVGKASKAVKSLPNSLSIKEASADATTELLDAIKERSV